MKPQGRCRHYDKEGNPVRGGCGNRKACTFLHPDEPGWKSAVHQQCRYYDEDGTPIDGGCRGVLRGQCFFTHPDDKDWSIAYTPLSRKKQSTTRDPPTPKVSEPPGRFKRRTQCKFYSADGTPLDGGCYGAGKCPYVHPGELEWSTAAPPFRRAAARAGERAPPIQRFGSDSTNSTNKDQPKDQPTPIWDAFDTEDKKSSGDNAIKHPSISISSSFSPTPAAEQWSGTGNGWGTDEKASTPSNSWGAWGADNKDNSTGHNNGWGSNSEKGDEPMGWGTSDKNNLADNGWGAEPNMASNGWGVESSTSDHGWGVPSGTTNKGLEQTTSSKAGVTGSDSWDKWFEAHRQESTRFAAVKPKVGVPNDALIDKDEVNGDKDNKKAEVESVAPPPRPRISIPSAPADTTPSQQESLSIESPAPIQGDSISPMSPSGLSPHWVEFVRCLRQAVMLQIKLNRVTTEYEQCKRIQLSEIFGHTGLDVRDYLGSWRSECRERVSHVQRKLEIAIDKVAQTYEEYMNQPTKSVAELKRDSSRLLTDLQKANDQLTTLNQKDETPQPQLEPDLKPSSDHGISQLTDLFEGIKNELESFLSYSYDQKMANELVEAEYSVQMKAGEEKRQKSEAEAERLKQGVAKIAFESKKIEDEVVEFASLQLDDRDRMDQIDTKMRELQEAYEMSLSQIEAWEAELEEESAQVATMAHQIQNILVPPIHSAEPRPPNPNEIGASIKKVTDAVADDIRMIMESMTSEAKRAASRDQTAVVNELVGILKPAHCVIRSTHEWTQNRGRQF